jgi:hypothetical protein
MSKKKDRPKCGAKRWPDAEAICVLSPGHKSDHYGRWQDGIKEAKKP